MSTPTAPTQSFANHRRLPPLFFIMIFVVLFIEFVRRGYGFFTAPTLENFWMMVVMFSVIGVAYYARANAQIVQDRVIMFEVKTRLAQILLEEQRSLIKQLSKPQLIGLRFASDDELPALVQATVTENLSNTDIKKRITNWQADWQRV